MVPTDCPALAGGGFKKKRRESMPEKQPGRCAPAHDAAGPEIRSDAC